MACLLGLYLSKRLKLATPTFSLKKPYFHLLTKYQHLAQFYILLKTDSLKQALKLGCLLNTNKDFLKNLCPISFFFHFQLHNVNIRIGFIHRKHLFRSYLELSLLSQRILLIIKSTEKLLNNRCCVNCHSSCSQFTL